MAKKADLLAVDMFCGAGGASTGLVRACDQLGLKLWLLAINHWPTAVQTHLLNHPGVQHRCEAIRTLDLDKDLAPDFAQAATVALPWLNNMPGMSWPALIADPPYTETDAEHYAPGRAAFPSANLILKNMLAVVRPGGRVGMLHYVLPQPPREGVRFVACVGVIAGYNNRMRCFSVFERETA